MLSSLDANIATEIYRTNCASANEAVIGRPFLIMSVGLALVLIRNSLTCLQIPLVKSSLPTGRVSSEISASENLVYCLLSSEKKSLRSGFLTYCLTGFPKQFHDILKRQLWTQNVEWSLCQNHLSPSKSLISSNRFLIPLFILYWCVFPGCIFMINSYSTHIDISVDRNANKDKSYINFSEMDHAKYPGVFLWQMLFTYLQGMPDRFNLSGFQKCIP